MSHNSYIRSGGTWASGSVLSSTEMAAFDAAQFKGLNADDGGTWSPSSQIILGGAGLRVSAAPFQLYGAGPALAVDFDPSFPQLTLQGGLITTVSGGGSYLRVDAGADLQVTSTGSASFASLVTITAGGLSVTHGGLSVGADGATITGGLNTNDGASQTDVWTLRAYSDVRFDGSSQIGSGVADVHTVNGTVGIVDTLSTGASSVTQFQGTVALQNAMTLSGAGQIVKRVSTAPDAAHTYSAADTDYLLLQDITANRTYTIATTGAVEGSRIVISGVPSAHTASVNYTGSSGSTSISFDASTTGFYRYAELLFNGSYWVLLENHVNN